MNRIPNRKQAVAGLIALLHVATSSVGYAANTDLSNTPLANVDGTATVKPNIMFVLDDSGSMGWDYTPDWVNDNYTCFDGKDDNGAITSWSTATSVTTSGASHDTCQRGDPPYMSSDFNKQYYNPAIYYRPPIKHDNVSGIVDTTELPSQNAANTSNWTAVKNDGYGIQSTGTTDLVTGYLDRAWCQNSSDTAIVGGVLNPNCRLNNAYSYPDYLYGYGKTVYGAPYYYTIGVSEYCNSTELTACQPTQDGIFAYPSILRWCTNSSFSDCRRTRSSTYSYPKILGTVALTSALLPAVSAKGSITVGDSGSSASVNVSSITINGVSVMNPAAAGGYGNGVTAAAGVITAANGTDTTNQRTSAAEAIANAINSYSATSGYSATSASNIVTITAVTPGAAPNGFTIAVNSTPYVVTPARATLTVNNSTATTTVTNLTVNGVPIISGTVTGCMTTNEGNCAAAIRTAINNYTSSPDYTATVSGTTVTISAPAALGNTPNGWAVVETGTVSTNSPRTMGNAVWGGTMPVTTVPMANGADATPGLVPLRYNVANFGRVNILPGNIYPKGVARTDCVGTSCTYDEEMTNFANWYAYYRTRMQMMKSSVGHAFLPLNINYRLGLNTINNTDLSSSNVSTSASLKEWLPLSDLTEAHKQLWYRSVYSVNPGPSTPLRTALDRMGKYYRGDYSIGASPTTPDPVQQSCQQNYTILTTDGLWNDSYTGVGNVDAAASTYCTRANGCLMPGSAGNTLADVALYYYKTDLRSGTSGGVDWDKNNVPTTAKDPHSGQHMTTFTLGLGVDGTLIYRKDYETATAGDFYKIKTGVLDWPTPASNAETTVDDLWHAAVNGHGTYFSAKDPDSLAAGLTEALNSLKIRTAAASASATSTPNVTQEDNDIFSATFRTVKWDGELIAQKVDTATGNLLPTITWQAQSHLDDKAEDTTDSRTIYTLNAAGPTPVRKDFAWGVLTAAEQAYFSNKCAGASPMTQCSTLTPAQQTQANDGANMVSFLRGQQSMENAEIYRDREHLFGDIASAKPAYVRNPRRSYGDAGYGAYKAAQESRQAMVYVAANDGMLHALNAATGEETWAYVPRMLLPELYRLADANYANMHRYYVDGSPETGDVYFTSDSAWHTILVGGLNKGGRGYYALDITDPASPVVLWEICADATLCKITDNDLGYTFGNPVITKRPADGKWVVLFASGYNNTDDPSTTSVTEPGSGRGFLYVVDAATGTILEKIDTGAGSTSNPSGLAKITGRAENAATDNTATLVYGGDLLGNVWRFNMATNTVTKLAVLTDENGATQPVTSRPDVGLCGTNQMVYVGTGKYLGTSDLTPPNPPSTDYQTQSMYGIKDNGTLWGTFRDTNAEPQVFQALAGGGWTLTDEKRDFLSAASGWYVDFTINNGERVNLDPALVLGTLVVVTNQPEDVSACSVGGNSYKYEFEYCSGSWLKAAPNSQVGKKIGSSIAVGFIVIRLPSGALKVISTFAGSEKSTEGVTGSGAGKVKRISWREVTD